MNRLTAHQKRVFVAEATKLLESNGFNPCTKAYNLYSYERQTKYGLVSVKIDAGDYCLSTFNRFDDPVKAKPILKRFEGNEYSGKCNFHSYDISQCINQFSHFLKQIV